MKNWVQNAVSNGKGKLKAKAKAAGAVTKKGTIKKSFLNKKSKSPVLNKEKALAKTLEAMHKGKTNNLKNAIMGGK